MSPTPPLNAFIAIGVDQAPERMALIAAIMAAATAIIDALPTRGARQPRVGCTPVHPTSCSAPAMQATVAQPAHPHAAVGMGSVHLEQDHPITEPFHLLHPVGDQDHRDAGQPLTNHM